MVYTKTNSRKDKFKCIFNEAIKVLQDVIKYLFLGEGLDFLSILYLATKVEIIKGNIKFYKNLKISKNNIWKLKV